MTGDRLLRYKFVIAHAARYAKPFGRCQIARIIGAARVGEIVGGIVIRVDAVSPHQQGNALAAGQCSVGAESGIGCSAGNATGRNEVDRVIAPCVFRYIAESNIVVANRVLGKMGSGEGHGPRGRVIVPVWNGHDIAGTIYVPDDDVFRVGKFLGSRRIG